jgi:peptidoglycan/xylan/chitin deacetylase (PgdA/CDA1 family)
MLKPILSMLSPAGAGARLNVFILHRVLPEQDPLFPSEMHAGRFNELCAWIASLFNVLPLDEAVAKLKAGTLPARAACMTFDDGYADNFRVATPILRQHNMTATFFVATGFLDGGRMWNDTVIESIRLTRLPVLHLQSVLGPGLGDVPVGSVVEKQAAIDAVIGQLKYRPLAERMLLTERIAELAEVVPPTDLMMRSDEVRGMRKAGMQVGAHTVSHPILATLDRAEAVREIGESKRTLESLLGERVGLFAYPNGKPATDYKAESVDVVREAGFDAAVSTHWAAARAGTDVFQIPRFTPWDRTRTGFGMRVMDNLRRKDLAN